MMSAEFSKLEYSFEFGKVPRRDVDRPATSTQYFAKRSSDCELARAGPEGRRAGPLRGDEATRVGVQSQPHQECCGGARRAERRSTRDERHAAALP